MRREKLKMAVIDLDFMEVKQKYMELQDSSKKNVDYEEYIKNEEAHFKIDLPSNLAEPYRMEDREEEKSEQKSHHDQDMESNRSERSSNKRGKRQHDIDKNSVLEPENSINSDFQSNADVPLSRNPSSVGGPLSQTTTTIPTQPPKDMKAKIDPTTVLQLSIMYHKLSYIGMQVDPNRIKISSTKAIKKEDYLNLSQKELEKELYFRAGTRPKTIKENEDTAGNIKYTIFTARSGRVMILRKPVGGRYEVMDKYKHDELPRSHRETANNLKRIKISENDEVEGIRHSTNPALQYQINDTFGDCYGLEDNTAEDSDESMSDNEKNDKDDYTSGFIERYRKRKGNSKRGNSNVISVRV